MGRKVNVIIKVPSEVTWDVPGDNFSNLDLINPILGGYAAGYQSQINHHGTTEELNVTLEATITMPKWPGYGSGSIAQQNEWNRFWRALKEHEDMHHKIAADEVSRFAKILARIIHQSA